MAIDVQHHRLFSGCRSGVLAVSNYQAGTIVATAPIGTGVDGAAYDPASADVFASNADGTLTVIHQDGPDRYQVAQTITTPQFSRNLGLDRQTTVFSWQRRNSGRHRPVAVAADRCYLILFRCS